MSRLIITVLSLCISASVYSQSVEGIWKNYTDDVVQSHIKVYQEDGKLYAKVIELFPHTKITHCKKCEGNQKDASLDEMLLFWDLVLEDKKWLKGRILDPNNGKHYNCEVELKDANTLKIRGYMGKPMFGKSFYWYRA
jgi:uncharacterized protein (DUF2147 family)